MKRRKDPPLGGDGKKEGREKRSFSLFPFYPSLPSFFFPIPPFDPYVVGIYQGDLPKKTLVFLTFPQLLDLKAYHLIFKFHNILLA
jgi:hypothetical protein